MHAPSDRGPQIGKRVAALGLLSLAPTVLAACSNGQSDTPTLQPPSTAAPGSISQLTPGPQVSIIKVNGLPVPQLAGQVTINTQLRQTGAALSGTCTVAVERDDSRVASLLWTCNSGSRTAVTFDQSTGRKLSLDDLFSGNYRAYLSSTAQSQMKADGVSNPSASDFSVWYLNSSSLVVAFPQSVVSFPFGSLGNYSKPGGLLSR